MNQTVDDNAFIDHLPNTKSGLKQMFEQASKHIRELEEKFFLEEDSEEERELKQSVKKQNVSVEKFNQQLRRLKEKSHIQ